MIKALSAVVSPVAVQIIDPTSRCNTSEIVFGPLTDGPFLGDLDDTLIHEPIIALEEEQITLPPTPQLLLIMGQLLLDQQVLLVNFCMLQ